MNPEECIIHIDSMSYGGRGIGRRGDGKVVFVPLVIPGEKVRVSVRREHKGYIEGEAVEFLETSPWRVVPPCPYFSWCGGCDWQHILYERQVKLKDAILKEQLKGKGVEASEVGEPLPSPREIAYRCHTTLRCSHGDGFMIGFYRRKSNDLVPIDGCLILNEVCRDILERMRRTLQDDPIVGLDAVDIHAPSDEVLVRFVQRGKVGRESLERMNHIYRNLNLRGLSVVFPDSGMQEYIFGETFCSYGMSLHGRRITLAGSFGGFIQANLEVNREMVMEVLEKASGSKTILDLYGGAGNFGIPLALSAERVTAVEQDRLLVKTGIMLARKNGCRGIRFETTDAARFMRDLQRGDARFDTVVLDPPREGAREVVQSLTRIRSDRIIYISCNPSTLARDLAVLVDGGFTVKSVRLFDMFPQTYHIESVTVLER